MGNQTPECHVGSIFNWGSIGGSKSSRPANSVKLFSMHKHGRVTPARQETIKAKLSHAGASFGDICRESHPSKFAIALYMEMLSAGWINKRCWKPTSFSFFRVGSPFTDGTGLGVLCLMVPAIQGPASVRGGLRKGARERGRERSF